LTCIDLETIFDMSDTLP